MIEGHSELLMPPRKRGFNEAEKMGYVRYGWRSSSMSKENIENQLLCSLGFFKDLIIGICLPISGLKTATKRQVFAFKHQSATERQMRGWVNLDEASITFIFQCCSIFCHILVN